MVRVYNKSTTHFSVNLVAILFRGTIDPFNVTATEIIRDAHHSRLQLVLDCYMIMSSTTYLHNSGGNALINHHLSTLSLYACEITECSGGMDLVSMIRLSFMHAICIPVGHIPDCICTKYQIAILIRIVQTFGHCKKKFLSYY